MPGISILFDIADTLLYHVYGHTHFGRSRWTTDQLTRAPLLKEEKEDEGAVPDATSKTAAGDFHV